MGRKFLELVVFLSVFIFFLHSIDSTFATDASPMLNLGIINGSGSLGFEGCAKNLVTKALQNSKLGQQIKSLDLENTTEVRYRGYSNYERMLDQQSQHHAGWGTLNFKGVINQNQYVFATVPMAFWGNPAAKNKKETICFNSSENPIVVTDDHTGKQLLQASSLSTISLKNIASNGWSKKICSENLVSDIIKIANVPGLGNFNVKARGQFPDNNQTNSEKVAIKFLIQANDNGIPVTLTGQAKVIVQSQYSTYEEVKSTDCHFNKDEKKPFTLFLDSRKIIDEDTDDQNSEDSNDYLKTGYYLRVPVLTGSF